MPYFSSTMPVPRKHSKWSWVRRMKVGQSKFVPATDDGARTTRTLCGILHYYRPMKFTISKRTERGKAGFRFWRIA